MVSRRKTVRFNTRIYKEKAILEAIKVYSKIADFFLVREEDYIKVYIKNIPPEFSKTLKDEFCNYVLGITKKCLRE